MGLFNNLFKGNQQEEKKLLIDISENGVSINGRLFDFPFDVSELEKILGQPERTKTFSPNEDGSENTIHTWDNIGVYAYAKKEYEIFDVSIKLTDTQEYDFQPLSPYKGNLTLNNITYKEAIKVAKKAYDTEVRLSNIKINVGLEYDTKEIIELNICKVKPVVKIKSDKYNFKPIDGEKIEFADFNFKLAIIEDLMYNKELLQPKFDVFEFVELFDKRVIDTDEEGYEPIPEVVDYFKKLEIDKKLAEQVTEIYQDGGNEVYMNIIPYWDGEDDGFNIGNYEDFKHFPNLKKMTLFENDPKVYENLKSQGINAQPL